MLNSTKIIGQILGAGGTVITSGFTFLSVSIKNLVDERAEMFASESSKDWFNKTNENVISKPKDKNRYAFKASSYQEDKFWTERYRLAKIDYDLSKTYKDNHKFDYMEQGWKRFRSFCYKGFEELKIQGANSTNILLQPWFEEWVEKKEYWMYCLNI